MNTFTFLCVLLTNPGFEFRLGNAAQTLQRDDAPRYELPDPFLEVEARLRYYKLVHASLFFLSFLLTHLHKSGNGGEREIKLVPCPSKA